MTDLQKENQYLKNEIENLKQRLRLKESVQQRTGTHVAKVADLDDKQFVTFVIMGASGDLAKKKTFPSLFALYNLKLLPQNFAIFGFARSKMSDEQFHKHVSQNFKEWPDKKDDFLKHCFYHTGQYDSDKSLSELDQLIKKSEGNKKGNRIFYMAVPPSIFVEVAKTVKHSAMSSTGWNRIIIEKPFGRDLKSSSELSKQLGDLFEEDQMFRIDHYLGKEMVQNLLTLRFANLVFEPLWCRQHISSVQITFKEDIGTDGRGGYFDEFGIIRDVMQNHLLQILALVAMETPVQLTAEDIRDEKVKVLRACEPIVKEDIVIGQYTSDKEGKNKGYKDDPTVPNDSIVPTFASAVIHINNSRWNGVPFILKCGKGLSERKAEIRVQFQHNPHPLYPEASRNELVIRVQPDEAVYMKFNTKAPGMSEDLVETELDLSYKTRFDTRLPDAYERLIYDVIRGDHNLFVRVDELEEAWMIFTPILHQLEREKIVPISYPFGSRGPPEADELAKRYGFIHSKTYTWKKE